MEEGQNWLETGWFEWFEGRVTRRGWGSIAVKGDAFLSPSANFHFCSNPPTFLRLSLSSTPSSNISSLGRLICTLDYLDPSLFGFPRQHQSSFRFAKITIHGWLNLGRSSKSTSCRTGVCDKRYLYSLHAVPLPKRFESTRAVVNVSILHNHVATPEATLILSFLLTPFPSRPTPPRNWTTIHFHLPPYLATFFLPAPYSYSPHHRDCRASRYIK